jgi:hypothetical protein
MCRNNESAFFHKYERMSPLIVGCLHKPAIQTHSGNKMEWSSRLKKWLMSLSCPGFKSGDLVTSV